MTSTCNSTDNRIVFNLFAMLRQLGGVLSAVIFTLATPPAVMGQPASSLVYVGSDGRLEYSGYANQGQTSASNRVIDYSYAGYKSGGRSIPIVPVEATVSPGPGDDTSRIQQAINTVSQNAPSTTGFRGAVLLRAGNYQISQTLVINTSGIVIRGEGQHSGGTVIQFTATVQDNAFEFTGPPGSPWTGGSRNAITNARVPSGRRYFHVEDASNFSVGDRVQVERVPNSAWIEALGMDQLGTESWDELDYDVRSPRIITSINNSNNRITVDAPLTQTIEKNRYGPGYLRPAGFNGISNVGIERIRLESNYISDDDNNHGWHAVLFKKVENSWARQLTSKYFGRSCVRVDGSINVTVEDCAYLDPKSEITGGNRYSFDINQSTHVLFQRCYSEFGRHSFATGSRTLGPNVFVDSLDKYDFGDIGPHHRYAEGLLFDNIRGGKLSVQDRQTSGSGHGWAGAQVMFWNCDASIIRCDTPVGAMNFAIGCIGPKTEGSYAPWRPFGFWESEQVPVTPRSLYYKQLEDRLGTAALYRVTTQEQREGPIWNALATWRGDSEATYLPPFTPLHVESEGNGTIEEPGWSYIAASVVNPLPDNFPVASKGWSLVSGPADVSFEDASEEITQAYFPVGGTYVLEYSISQNDNRDPQNIISYGGSGRVILTVRDSYVWEGSTNSNWNISSNWASLTRPQVNSSNSVYGSNRTILIQNGPHLPASNIPKWWAHSGAGTPRFALEDGSSLSINMSSGSWDGTVGPGTVVSVGSGASLTWGNDDASNQIRLARSLNGTFVYEVIGGDFTIETNRLQCSENPNKVSYFDLDGGKFTFTGSRIDGSRSTGGSFANSSSLVTLTNGSSFDASSAQLRNMKDSSGNPTMVFDLQDYQSGVTARLSGPFPNITSLEAAVGTTWTSSSLGNDNIFFEDNGDQTFTAKVYPGNHHIWRGSVNNQWSNPANWSNSKLPQISSGAVYGDDVTIVISNGVYSPTENVPHWADFTAGTPSFVLEDGASLSMDRAVGGYGGPFGDGPVVTVQNNASLTWGSAGGENMRLARGGSLISYNINGGEFTINTDRIQFSEGSSQVSRFHLDGGTFRFTGIRLDGARSTGGSSFASEFSLVTLENGSLFDASSAQLRNMYDSSGNPTMVFDLQDHQSEVTARLSSPFSNIASVQEKFGTTWISSTLGNSSLSVVNNGDGTFTVKAN